MDNLIKIVAVVGPTASGKTKLSVELAKNYNGEIISADSMQIYKGMDIATAKPSNDEKCGIRHHLMDFLLPSESYSVACFVEDAKKCVADIVSRNKLPIIAGGTGLYVDSFLNNVNFSDEKRDDVLTQKLWKIYDDKGIDTLLEMLDGIDKTTAEKLAPQKNPKRIIRAIEFYKTTGKPISQQVSESTRVKSPYRAVKIGLNFNDRQKLYDRINLRVDKMMDDGLLDEAKEVLSSNLSATSVKAIGYKELAPYIMEKKSLDECVEKLKQETRRYAKRQITWFKRDKDINWLCVDEYDSFEELYKDACQIIEKENIDG